MKLTKEQFSEITLVLENEGDFYRFYSRMEGKTFGQRREAFKAYTPFIGDLRHWMKGIAHFELDVEDRDQLRRYFDERYELPQDEINKYAHIPDIWVEKAPEAEVKSAPFDYTTLPDGVILTTRDGREYVKGKIANGGGGGPGSHSDPLFGANTQGHTWCHWDQFGQTKSQLLCVATYRIPNDFDYSQLPDGTRLKTRGGRIVFKGVYSGTLHHVKPPLTVSGFAVWIPTGEATVGHVPYSSHGVNTSNYDWDIVGFAEDADQFTPAEIAALKAQGCPPLEFNRITLDQAQQAPVILVTTTKEEDIMTKAIKVTTKTFVNDVDAASMTNAQIYDLIAEQEAKIKELDKIENKPKRLATEIEERKAGIAALVAHLDAQEA